MTELSICTRLQFQMAIQSTPLLCIVKFNSSRPPSVRVDHGYSILVVCLAEASAAMTVKTDA